MLKTIGNSWDKYLKDEFSKDYFLTLENKIDELYQTKTCYPKMENIFNAFKLTPYECVKVVILGQDPYHNEGEAMGLCFSVPEDIKIPPSLVNIYKEMISDTEVKKPRSGDLTNLAKEGVFLLNTTLTVEKNKPLSHLGLGWEIFTDNVISILNNKKESVVFILWGNNARGKKRLITNPIHLVLEAPHPSPLSAYNGFFGSKPFSKANKFLMKNEIEPVDWSVIE